jgi:catechol 2,3-dioxygenase-like lactoylglutathione lyase family enzyme
MKQRYLDHIDLRVRNLARARDFYARILPALGFTCDRSDTEWGTFYAAGQTRPEAFFGFTEDAQHQPNGTRIAFWAESRAEVDRFAEVAREAGARNLEGPELCTGYSPGYYAFFFEDPDGNKLEICYREQPVVNQ